MSEEEGRTIRALRLSLQGLAEMLRFMKQDMETVADNMEHLSRLNRGWSIITEPQSQTRSLMMEGEEKEEQLYHEGQPPKGDKLSATTHPLQHLTQRTSS
ncbi:hypothetical protein QOT17_013843 [Balamuthia mandrillaris]